MKLKYRKKTYDSDNVPLFLYFKTSENRKDFINILNNYTNFGEFIKIPSMHSALMGNIVVNDRRSSVYFNIEKAEEKRSLQKMLYDNIDNTNAIMCSPEDIGMHILMAWVDRYADEIK